MKFKSMYSGFESEKEVIEKFGCDYKPEMVGVYQELPPLAKDKDGKIINLSVHPKIIKVSEYNLDEKIQSFRDDSEVYSLLKRFANSNDDSWLNVANGQYIDISGMPNSFNDLYNLKENIFNNLAKFSQEEQEKFNEIFNFYENGKVENKEIEEDIKEKIVDKKENVEVKENE